MLGSSIYLVGREVKTGEYVERAMPCAMCKRLIINAGIENVYIRDTKDDYRIVPVQEWIDNDDSLEGSFGY
jgi:dCMP deaminase